MTPRDIKIELILKGKDNLAELARDFTERLNRPADRPVRREEVSMCIRQVREYPELQELIAEVIGKPVEQLFPNRRKVAQFI